MKYYKLGDYWYKGAPTFYELLTKYSIVICGNTQMCIGDIVAIAEGHTIFAVAQLSSNSYQANTRIELRDEFGEYDIPFDDNYIANARIYKLNSYITYPLQQGICEIHKPDIISKLNNEISKIMSTELILKCKTILQNNHNLILTGAPGTGKTYLAKEIAKSMGCSDDEIGFVQFHPSYDYTDFVEGLRPMQDDNGTVGFERKDGVFKEFCKKAISKQTIELGEFDRCWDMLIERIRTSLKDCQLTKIGNWEYGLSKKESLKYQSTDTKSNYTFTITKKNIKDTYEGKIARPSGGYQKDMNAIVDYLKSEFSLNDYVSVPQTTNNDKPFVFIIDEINRGEISKIFGELFFSVDPGYRGLDENDKPKGLVKTQYQNLVDEDDEFFGGFFVPENVYIIGTMNDIDRSVESMDFAFRRRFAFKEIKANENIGMLDELGDVKDEAKKRMLALNEAISKISGLNSAYHIGGAYFLKLKNYDNDFNVLWDNHLDGLLREYLRGRRQDEIEDQMKTLKQAYDTAN